MRRRSPCIVLIAWIVVATAWGVALQAERFVVVEGDSVLAVITHKAGIASGLAHNHFVVVGHLSLVLDFDPNEPTSASFRFEAAIEDLIVDGPGRHEQWSDRLQELSILGEGPKALSEKIRAKIRTAMLGRRQLDAATFPTFSVEVVGFEKSPATLGGVDFPYTASIEVELHGTSRRFGAASRYEWDGQILWIEAVAEAYFSDFGIEPYSAILGAIKNQDRFHFFLSLKAKPAAIVLDAPAVVPGDSP